jgi:hypothetical protein
MPRQHCQNRREEPSKCVACDVAGDTRLAGPSYAEPALRRSFGGELVDRAFRSFGDLQGVDRLHTVVIGGFWP